MKDWNGNSKATFVTLGASNHSEHDREEHDFYSTDPSALELFLDSYVERDGNKLCNTIYECACGKGHLSKVLINHGYDVKSTDLIDRGYGIGGVDFLKTNLKDLRVDVLTNPPYKYAQEFIEHALDIVADEQQVIMFLKIQFLEGQKRRKLFDEHPPKYVYVNSKRQTCYINGDMSEKISSAACYCWFVWEKGFKGNPTIKWI